MTPSTFRVGASSVGACPRLARAAVPSPSRRETQHIVNVFRAATAPSGMGRARGLVRAAASWWCDECNRTFVSEHGLAQHNAAKHSYVQQESDNDDGDWKWSLSTLDAPVDTPGHWVERSDFWGRKSFGAFECRRCGKTWLSAHAFKSYRQGCKSCNSEYFPRFLWVNEGEDNRDRTSNLIDPSKPHDEERCEACRHGVCHRLNTY